MYGCNKGLNSIVNSDLIGEKSHLHICSTSTILKLRTGYPEDEYYEISSLPNVT